LLGIVFRIHSLELRVCLLFSPHVTNHTAEGAISGTPRRETAVAAQAQAHESEQEKKRWHLLHIFAEFVVMGTLDPDFYSFFLGLRLDGAFGASVFLSPRDNRT
jgi:hypothetical protein